MCDAARVAAAAAAWRGEGGGRGAVCYDCVLCVTEKRWSSLKELSDSCGRSLTEMVDDLRGFDTANAQIAAWLVQKEKMIAFLGPLAAEPVMVRNQIQQLEVTAMLCS